ncbi:MAG TPA: hypothetical protein VFM81_06360 [Actinomycetota bacterium]|nr:hypothetical protein [Actinomycetota bacterium]
MGRRILPSRLVVLAAVLALVTTLGAAEASTTRPASVLWYREAFEARIARQAEAARTLRSPSQPVLDDFSIVGHNDLGATDITGDVWVHKGTAYLGTWAEPCNGLGVKVVRVTDPANPTMLGRVAGIPGTSAEDVVVRDVHTSSFNGDLLVAGIQRCDFDDPELDDDTFGVDIWNVSNPASPVHFTHFGVNIGGGGVHELDLFQRGPNVYALLATPFSEWFDPSGDGDFWIVDLTNPASPAIVGEWGAGQEGLSRGPFFGQGSFGASFAHSARASANGMQAFVSYWDLGVVTLDISDVTDPTFVSHTTYQADADGDAHSLVPYSAGGTDFILQNDEDFDPRSPGHVIVAGHKAGIFNDAPYAPAIFFERHHRINAKTIRPRHEGCSRSDYGGTHADGRIAVVKTLDPSEEKAACNELRQARIAQREGAAAILHDFRSNVTSPQFFDSGGGIDIPVAFTDHATARDTLDRGRATLRARRGSWGFLRVFDADTGAQVAAFDDLPYVHDIAGPSGAWSIHNTEVAGDHAYSSWYSHGIVALDLTSLASATPADPAMVGQFVPKPGASSPTKAIPPGDAQVWGVFVDPISGLVYASDMLTGLWIVDPTGDAEP